MYKLLMIGAVLGTAACSINPQAYETDPVVVDTEYGPVTCQLYTKNLTTWDRAIDRPDNMSVQAGDQICRDEGERRKSSGA